jgi:hypothetical protein
MTNGVEVSSRTNAIIIPAVLRIRPKLGELFSLTKADSVEIPTDLNSTELNWIELKNWIIEAKIL